MFASNALDNNRRKKRNPFEWAENNGPKEYVRRPQASGKGNIVYKGHYMYSYNPTIANAFIKRSAEYIGNYRIGNYRVITVFLNIVRLGWYSELCKN